jgi:hypothetical protein
VDLGLWLSERRGAQADADFVALAGAWELLNPSATQSDVQQAADSILRANQEETDASGNGTAELVNLSISGDCVEADVRHSSISLFSGIFGIFAPDIGAHAKACAGATNAPPGIVPIEVNTHMADCFESNGTPKFDSLCPMDFDASGSNPRGLLDLEAPDDYCSDSSGSGNLYKFIEWGATGTCLVSEPPYSCDPVTEGPWYDCVAVQNGNPTRVVRAVEQRVGREGACDSDNSRVEEFDETVETVFSGTPGLYEPRDCDTSQQGAQISPRLVGVIVLKQPPTSSDAGNPIHAFASMYIVGCSWEPPSQTPPDLDPDCANRPSGSGSGHAIVYGRLVNMVVENSGTGSPTNSTTSFSISLEE